MTETTSNAVNSEWQPDLSDYLVRQALAEPIDWTWAGVPIHEWRWYITDEIKAIWTTFSPRQKVAIMRMADKVADKEEYD